MGIIKINKKNCSIQCFLCTLSAFEKRLNREYVYEKKSVFYGWVAVGSCPADVRLRNVGARTETRGAGTADGADFCVLGKVFIDTACVHSIFEHTGPMNWQFKKSMVSRLMNGMPLRMIPTAFCNWIFRSVRIRTPA